ncbi:MAG: hypothetical protein M3237_02930 [Actinomycetota bacterium]|nr:hypothetical protein [Actinomycetota bacterium]
MSTDTVRRTRTRRSGTPYLTLAAGGLFVVIPLLVEFVSGDVFLLMGLAGALVLAAMPGLRHLQRGADGRAGSWGLRLTMCGLCSLVLLILSGDLIDAGVSGGVQAVVEAVFLVVGGTATLALLLGIVLFSVGMTRARVFPPAAIWVFLGGMVIGLVSELFEQSLHGPVPWLADTLPPLGFVVAGLGLLAIGRAALDRR